MWFGIQCAGLGWVGGWVGGRGGDGVEECVCVCVCVWVMCVRPQQMILTQVYHTSVPLLSNLTCLLFNISANQFVENSKLQRHHVELFKLDRRATP